MSISLLHRSGSRATFARLARSRHIVDARGGQQWQRFGSLSRLWEGEFDKSIRNLKKILIMNINSQVFQWKLLNHVSRDHNMTLKPAHLSYKCTVCTATFGMYKLFENHVYSAHSTVAKKDNNKNKSSTSTASSSGGSSNSLLKPLRINDEITIIPQPAKKLNDMESHVIGELWLSDIYLKLILIYLNFFQLRLRWECEARHAAPSTIIKTRKKIKLYEKSLLNVKSEKFNSSQIKTGRNNWNWEIGMKKKTVM